MLPFIFGREFEEYKLPETFKQNEGLQIWEKDYAGCMVFMFWAKTISKDTVRSESHLYRRTAEF